MRHTKLPIALLFLLTFAHAAFGQTGGVITGVISDPAGAVISNAPIEAKNSETGVVVSAATSATGNYVLGDLPAGTYEISTNVPGFKRYVRTGITVQQLQTTRVDVVLEIGTSNESVTVNAEAPLLKTESGDVSQNVTTAQVDALPMGQIGSVRVTTQAVLTIPGVNGTPHFDQHQWHAGRQRTDPDRRSGRNLHFGECLLLVWSAQRGFRSGGRDTNQ